MLPKFAHNNKKYFLRPEGYWVDSTSVIAAEIVQNELSKEFLKGINFRDYSIEELTKIAHGMKSRGATFSALKIFDYLLDTGELNSHQVGIVLPQVTSALRFRKSPREAIEYYLKAVEKYDYAVFNTALLKV